MKEEKEERKGGKKGSKGRKEKKEEGLMKESRIILQHQQEESRNCPDKDQSENTP